MTTVAQGPNTQNTDAKGFCMSDMMKKPFLSVAGDRPHRTDCQKREASKFFEMRGNSSISSQQSRGGVDRLGTYTFCIPAVPSPYFEPYWNCGTADPSTGILAEE